MCLPVVATFSGGIQAAGRWTVFNRLTGKSMLRRRIVVARCDSQGLERLAFQRGFGDRYWIETGHGARKRFQRQNQQ